MSSKLTKRLRLNPGSDDHNRGASLLSSTTTFSELPSEVFLRLLSFFDSSERLQLTLVFNKRLLKEIEEYSKRVYQKIKSDHRVDETFADRVADQTNLQTTLTGRAKPVTLPFRYLSTVAMSQPLYTLENVGGGVVLKVLMSPSEDILAVVGNHAEVSLFNLSERDAPATDLEVWALDSSIYFLEDNLIVTSSRSSLCLYSKPQNGGDWECEILLGSEDTEPPFSFLAGWIRHDQKLLGFAVDEWGADDFPEEIPQVSLIAFDINSRSVLQQTLATNGSEVDDAFSLEQFDMTVGFSSSNNWCLFCLKAFGGRYIHDFAYNIETNERKIFMYKRFGGARRAQDDNYNSFDDHFMRSMKQASDSSRTFFAIIRRHEDRGSLEVYGLGDDGYLSKRFEFSVDGGVCIAAATQSRVFLQHGSFIDEYNAETGVCCRRLGIDDEEDSDDEDKRLHCIVSKKRNVLYVPEDGITIKAFCLEEPSII